MNKKNNNIEEPVTAQAPSTTPEAANISTESTSTAGETALPGTAEDSSTTPKTDKTTASEVKTETAEVSTDTASISPKAEQSAAQTQEAAKSAETESKTPAPPSEDQPGLGNSADIALRGYLANGYYRGEGKGRYVDPDLVDQAAEIGKELAAGGATPAAFNRMVKTLKSAAKLPYEAQVGALKKLVPQVLEQERKKKAPPLLREVVERNRAAIQSEADFAACLDHFGDISIFLAAQAVAEGTPKK